MMDVSVAHIVAIAAQSRAIGKDNQLLWHVPEDLAHFKRTTLGKPIIMGRKTYDSVGFPLPGRTNIVVSRDPDLAIDGVEVVTSCDAAIALGKQYCQAQCQAELFIVGGAEIYRQTLAATDKIYLSVIGAQVEGDTHYPDLPASDWQLVSEQLFPSKPNEPSFRLEIYTKK